MESRGAILDGMAQSEQGGGISQSYSVLVGRFVSITSLVVAGTGTAVLLGWVFDVHVLKGLLPGAATMKVNTACAFMVAGSAMWLLATDVLVNRVIARVLLVVVVVGGVLTMAESVFSIDLGIDQLILSDSGQYGAAPPGRMAPVSSLCFCFIGIAMLSLPRRSSGRSSRWATWIALPVGLMSMVAVVGYAYDAAALYRFQPYSSMAIHTALLFAILSLDVFCANPARGIISIAISETAAGVVSRRLLPTIPLALFVLGWIRLIGQNMGLYDTHTGLAIMVVASMAVSTVAIALTVSALHAVDLRRERAEVIQQEMMALVASTDDTILTKGLDGVVRSWNPAAERLLGYRADEMVGRAINVLIPDDRQDEESTILEQVRRGERVSHFETIRRRKDGSLVDVSLTISPILDNAGTVVGASKIMRDITERKRVQDELRRMNEDLGVKNKELDDFVHTASHDLRSPLNGVETLVHWIMDDDGALSAESRARLTLISGRIERMKKLLSDIRDYARAGQFSALTGERSTASALVAEVAATVDARAGISIRSDPSLEGVQVSRVPLEQVLHNLIGNAIKHHDRETGVVTVSVERRGQRLRFFVIDDGPGVPEEFRALIFEMFKTLKPRDEVEGSGMGLAIVRKIVGRMGGNCGIESADGCGARFWFDWPGCAADIGAT